MARSGKRGGKQGQLRIIGGQWRGRKLTFTAQQGLRPTSDRMRETLFNWLAPSLHGAACADLFAGSGALGLEALSRGAGNCDFVDTSAAALQQIKHHLATLDASALAHCHPGAAQQFLEQAGQPYDIVFIDPPFGQQLVQPACETLTRRHLLHRESLVYVEMGLQEPEPELPETWELYRDKSSGGVAYRLYRIDTLR